MKVSCTILVFWQLPSDYVILNGLMMILMGCFVYGPQILAGVASADFASKKANSAIIGKELNKMAGEQCQNLLISSYLTDILGHNINTNMNKHLSLSVNATYLIEKK